MQCAINTDFLVWYGSPEPYLRYIAEAGFSHVFWCHQWKSDFLYSSSEIDQIGRWLKTYNLKLLDIHASCGIEKCWFSPVEYERKAGVELVLNRVRMLAELNCEGNGALTMHMPVVIDSYLTEVEKAKLPGQLAALMRSLDDLIPYLEKYGVKIAVENGYSDDFELIGQVLETYPAECIALTYDSGHGNMNECKGAEYLKAHLDRLEVLHLNDNNGVKDLHQPAGYGTLNWEELAEILAQSSYCKSGKPLSWEISMGNTPYINHELQVNQKPESFRAFLQDCFTRCQNFDRMVKAHLTE